MGAGRIQWSTQPINEKCRVDRRASEPFAFEFYRGKPTQKNSTIWEGEAPNFDFHEICIQYHMVPSFRVDLDK